MTGIPTEIREQVRRRRLARGWTQEKLGQVSGTSERAVNQLENCANNPCLDTVVMIANALDCDLTLTKRLP